MADEKVQELLRLAHEELKQLAEEGCDTWELERGASLIESEGGADQMKRALAAIRERRPAGPRHIAAPQPPAVLDDRTLGAWLGRAAGCMLGKPVEGRRRESIDDWLAACGLTELDDYFPEPPGDSGIDFAPWCRGAFKGHVNGALRDDDTDYTIIGLRILEQHGRDFSPDQVAEFWLAHVPYHCTYTAERVAYRNLVNGMRPPESARYRNPYREWIGAQIRADAFGYVCPGGPEEAAGLAFRDACISHVKNGIYGEMWVAAMLAAAFVAGEPARVIDMGLTEVPERCRLADAVRQVVDWHAEGIDAGGATDRVLQEFAGYHRVHTINNAAIVAMALLWGESDFTRTIGLAVRAGLDTDCNGAAAGSVLGAMMGAAAIPEHWTAPLNDRIETIVAGEPNLTISGLAARTRALQPAP